MTGNVWSIVLAAGDGTRLETLTTGEAGSVPKQYCAFGSSKSLLQHAIDRAAAVSTATRVVPVVAARHRRWWVGGLGDVPVENVVVQPENRGTAAGILLPLFHVLRRDPNAIVAVFPSDHFVEQESVLNRSVREGVEFAGQSRGGVVLIGTKPEALDPGFGWISPGLGAGERAMRVRSFVEKPDTETAKRLMCRHGLVNTFIFAARAATLVRLYHLAAPGLLDQFVRAASSTTAGGERLAALYREIPVLDFSREILQSASVRSSLSVIEMPSCGWSDLGTPERVLATCARYRVPRDVDRTPHRHAPLDLAQVVA